MFSELSFGLFAIVDGVFAIIIKAWITRGLWNSFISYWYYCFVKLENWICGISDHFRLKFFPAHLFVQGPVSFVKSVSRAPPIGSVPIYEKSQRKSHITGKIYILLIIDNLYSIFFLCI
jgi:hypothetical protein